MTKRDNEVRVIASSLLDRFTREFHGHLGDTPRWKPFCQLICKLGALDRPVRIVETGTAREKGNWKGDGQSTLIWNMVIDEIGGKAFSIDTDTAAVYTAQQQAPAVRVSCGDSILYLRNYPRPDLIDLLFLDSYDWGDTKLAQCCSELHHAGELAAIFEQLRPGCLIAVDDCHAIDRGKHVLVQEFFNRLGVEPIFRGYITIWQKP